MIKVTVFSLIQDDDGNKQHERAEVEWSEMTPLEQFAQEVFEFVMKGSQFDTRILYETSDLRLDRVFSSSHLKSIVSPQLIYKDILYDLTKINPK